MKNFSLASILLLSVATVFGVKDYMLAKNTGLLSKLYVDSLQSNKFINNPEKDITDIKAEDYSRSVVASNINKKYDVINKAIIKKIQIKKNVKPIYQPIKEKKTIADNSKLKNLKFANFSRGRIIIPLDTLVKAKTDTLIALEDKP